MIKELLTKLLGFKNRTGRSLGRRRYMDSTAITYRMNAGYPGDVNRMHPASILPSINDASAPVVSAGLLCMFNGSNNDVRGVATGDEAANGTTVPAAGSTTYIAGVAVRPYPTQQAQASSNFAPATIGGAASLASGQPMDVLTSGFIMVQCVGTPNKGSPVYVWAAASTGSHVQGGFETSPSSGNTFGLPSTSYFNGPPDSSGNVELAFNI